MNLEILALHAPLGSIAIVEDTSVQLQRVDPETGALVDVLCVRIGTRLHFHPARLEQLKRALKERAQ